MKTIGFASREVNLRITPSDVASVGNGTSSRSPAGSLQRAQEAANALAALKTSPRQAALDKAGALQRRLEMLEAMLRFASPEMAAKLAQELKSIAKELGKLGQSIGSQAAPAAHTAATAGNQAAATETSAERIAAALPESDAGASADANSGLPDETPHATSNGGTDLDGEVLRKVLLDAKKRVEALAERLKAKLRAGDEEARRDLDAAEKEMQTLDRALSQDASQHLYSALGRIAGSTASPAISPSASALVDISV